MTSPYRPDPRLSTGTKPGTSKPRLLDAFCRKGGASAGYIRAGFDVTGIDIEDHSDGYPGSFVIGDAVQYIADHGHEYDAIHSSPPCQANIAITAGNRGRPGWADDHVNLIPDTRAALESTGRPWIIENGPSEQLRPDLVLCGLMFGLCVFRHRYFEVSGWRAIAPQHITHSGHRVSGWRHGIRYDGDMFAVYGDGGGKGTLTDWQRAMGIDWMTEKKDLAEAIPPAYTEYIGKQLLASL